MTHEISTLSQSCNNTDVLKTVKKHLQSAISLLRHCNNTTADEHATGFENKLNVAPNSNTEPQLRFHSTKKCEKQGSNGENLQQKKK